MGWRRLRTQTAAKCSARVLGVLHVLHSASSAAPAPAPTHLSLLRLHLPPLACGQLLVLLLLHCAWPALQLQVGSPCLPPDQDACCRRCLERGG